MADKPVGDVHRPIGVQGNAWNNVAVLATGVSNTVDLANQATITAFGHVSAATTITVLESQDGTTFYASQNKQVLAAAADFAIDFRTGARYVQLQSTGAATITATIAGKDA